MNNTHGSVSIHHLLAGALARSSTAIILSPIDFVKSRVQYSGNLKVFTSPFTTVKQTIRTEGILAFYRGLGPRLMYTVPSAAISFYFYEHFRILFEQSQRSTNNDASVTLSPLIPLFAGVVARVFGSLLRSPLDMLKYRLQIEQSTNHTNRTPFSRTFDLGREIIKQKGLPYLWRGYRITLLRDGFFSAVYFPAYEILKLYLSRLNEGKTIFQTSEFGQHLKFFTSGSIAGAFATVLTYPADTVKVRLQAEGVLERDFRQYSGIINAFKTIIKTEGIMSLYSGISMRLMYISPAAAITFTSYEYFKKLFQLT